MTPPPNDPSDDTRPGRVPLEPGERRVLGVLVEKAKTTPEYYPLTVAAVVTGSNQKSNRDPVTNFDADDVEDLLQSLRRKGATVMVEGGGRVVRWKHTLYDWLKVSKVELAVVAELLLRGPQTEGDLRARASRMEPLPDLSALQEVLEPLAERGLVTYLTPPGQKRGVVVTHNLYPPAEAERVRQAHAQSAPAFEPEEPRGAATPRAATPPRHDDGWRLEATALRAEVDALRAGLDALAEEVRALKSALGV